MIVSDVVTRVLRQFGDEAGVQVEEADIIRWINDAVDHISVANDLMQATGTLSSVAGTNTYNFPSDMLAMSSMYYNSVRLKYLKKQEYDEYINASDPTEIQSGTPLIYTRWGTQFTLYPRPDTAVVNGIKLLYIQRQPDVDDASDTLPLPEEYHPEIVKYCLQQAYQTDEDWDAAGQMADQFQDGVDRLKEVETLTDRQTYPVLTVLQDDW